MFFSLLLTTQRKTSLAHDLPTGSDWHGHMLLFDGVNQLANLGEIQLPDPYNGMTIEALAKPICDLERNMNILASIEGGDFKLFVNFDETSETYSFGFELYTSDGHVATVLSDPINCDGWYHVAGVYDGYNLSLYIDGKLEERIIDDGYVYPAHPTSPLYIGAEYQEGGVKDYYHGWVDEARLWNYPRNPTQIYYYQYHKVSCDSTNLIGYWDLDDPGPSTPTQIIGNCAGENGFLGFSNAVETADPVWEDSNLPKPPSGQWIRFYFPIVMNTD